VNWLAWILFGAVAGWLASLVVRDSRPRGCLTNMLTGILGAVLGGFVYRIATGDPWNFRFDFASFGVAVLGAIVLILVINLATRRSIPPKR
jgi:uncharacterized membrane protein YeaQ/YmgE (transglycosylase-associated protein family)